MNDMDNDTLLGRHLSGDQPRESFRARTLRDSTAALIQVRRRRHARRAFALSAAAVLIAGFAFIGGRLTAPAAPVGNYVNKPQLIVEPDTTAVPNELLAWLEAARLFGQLGMEDRMARAVKRAGRLLPADSFMIDSRIVPAGSTENQNEPARPTGTSGPHPSAESMNRILAQSFGD